MTKVTLVQVRGDETQAVWREFRRRWEAYNGKYAIKPGDGPGTLVPEYMVARPNLRFEAVETSEYFPPGGLFILVDGAAHGFDSPVTIEVPMEVYQLNQIAWQQAEEGTTYGGPDKERAKGKARSTERKSARAAKGGVGGCGCGIKVAK